MQLNSNIIQFIVICLDIETWIWCCIAGNKCDFCYGHKQKKLSY